MSTEENVENWKLDTPNTPFVYHYTDINGIEGILSNKTLLVSEFQFLNDTLELRHIQERIKKLIESGKGNDDFIKVFSSINNVIDRLINMSEKEIYFHIFSCSVNSDSLTLWKNYSNNCGYCLCFDYKKLMQSFQSMEKASPVRMGNASGKVIYSGDQIDAVILQEHEEAKAKHGEDGAKLGPYLTYRIVTYAMFYKERLFSPEEEYRYVVSCTKDKYFDNIKFMKTSNYIRPCISINFNPDCLKSVIIGPTNKYRNAEKSLEYYLKASGFNMVDILRSKIPYQ